MNERLYIATQQAAGARIVASLHTHVMTRAGAYISL